MLRIELALLQEADYDLGLVGFDDEEQARLLVSQESVGGLTIEDAVPELPENSYQREWRSLGSRQSPARTLRRLDCRT